MGSKKQVPRYLTYISIGLLTACASEFDHSDLHQQQKTELQAEEADTVHHGYHELANPDNRESFVVSDFNTDNPEIKNISRPKACTIKTDLDTSILFGIWTSDPDGPHADFMLSSDFFHVVDYDGNGDMPYELLGRNLKIYYNDFIQEGKIISVDKSELKIKWKSFEQLSTYLPWTQ